MTPTDRHGIAAFDCANLSSCTQLINEPTHKLGNYLDLLLTDVPCVVDPLVDPPLSNSDHSSISFFVKIGFKVPNISFSCKVDLKSRVHWPHFGDGLLNHNWSVIYNRLNPVSEFNKFITSLVDRRIPSKVISKK